MRTQGIHTMIIQGAAVLLFGVVWLLIGITTAEVGVAVFGLFLTLGGGGTLWMAFRKGGPYDFRS